MQGCHRLRIPPPYAHRSKEQVMKGACTACGPSPASPPAAGRARYRSPQRADQAGQKEAGGRSTSYAWGLRGLSGAAPCSARVCPAWPDGRGGTVPDGSEVDEGGVDAGGGRWVRAVADVDLRGRVFDALVGQSAASGGETGASPRSPWSEWKTTPARHPRSHAAASKASATRAVRMCSAIDCPPGGASTGRSRGQVQEAVSFDGQVGGPPPARGRKGRACLRRSAGWTHRR